MTVEEGPRQGGKVKEEWRLTPEEAEAEADWDADIDIEADRLADWEDEADAEDADEEEAVLFISWVL